MSPTYRQPRRKRLQHRRHVGLEVVTEDDHGVRRPEVDPLGDLIEPAHDELVDVGESVALRERGPMIDDDRLVAELARHPHERHRDLLGAHDDQAGTHGKDLDEELPAFDGDRSGSAARDRLDGSVADRRTHAIIARAACHPIVLMHDDARAWDRPFGCGARVDLVPWRPGRQLGDHGAGTRPTVSHDAGGLQGLRRDEGLDEHVERAAAREPDAPRLLVADAVADDAAQAGLARSFDLHGGRAFDTSAAHRPGHPSVLGQQERRARQARSRAERADDDRAPDAGRGIAPGVDRVDQVPHRAARSGWRVRPAARGRCTTGTPVRSGRRLRSSAICARRPARPSRLSRSLTATRSSMNG